MVTQKNKYTERNTSDVTSVASRAIIELARYPGKLKKPTHSYVSIEPYRLDDFEEGIAKNQAILLVPSPADADLAIEHGVVATCLQRDAKRSSEWKEALKLIKNTGLAEIWIIPDNSRNGWKEAQEIAELCYFQGIACQLLHPMNIWDKMPYSGNLSSMCALKAMSDQEFYNRIIEAYRTELEETFQKDAEITSDYQTSVLAPNKRYPDNDIDLKALLLDKAIDQYLAEDDLVKQLLMKSSILSQYRLNKDGFNAIVNQKEKFAQPDLQTTFRGLELFKYKPGNTEWLSPDLLPRANMLLLAGDPKVGKSLLATDITYAVLTGGQFFGDQIKPGRVLYLGDDEPLETFKDRLRDRGVDLIPEEIANERFLVERLFEITQLKKLEKILQDFKPTLVVIDSLTKITETVGVSENDPEFARYLYRLNSLLLRYDAASIVIHHTNKNKNAKGLEAVAGSKRITAAVWGVATIKGDVKTNQRTLDIIGRCPSPTMYLSINPTDTWIDDGILKKVGEVGDENGQKKSQGELVLELLKQHYPSGLEPIEINQVVGIGENIYSVLRRLRNKNLIARERSQVTNKWIYTYISLQSDDDKDEPEPTNPPSPPENLTLGLENSTTIAQTGLPKTNTNLTPTEHGRTRPNTLENNSEQKSNLFGDVRPCSVDVRKVLVNENLDQSMDTAIVEPSVSFLDDRGGCSPEKTNQLETESNKLENNSDYLEGEVGCLDAQNDRPSQEDNNPYDGVKIFADIDSQMKKIGMTQAIGKKYLLKVYEVPSRYSLSDEQLIDFWQYLQLQKDLTNIMRVTQ